MGLWRILATCLTCIREVDLAEKVYDVALSFAGEQRGYVEEVSKLLDGEVSCFYDKQEQVYLWGRDLYNTLDSVYRLQALYVVMFVSEDYAAKMWPNHERVSAQARAVKETDPYVLPVRFDDTEVPGLRETVGHLDARLLTPSELAANIIEKVKQHPRWIPPQTASTTASDRGPGWEFLLLAEQLERGMASFTRPAYEYRIGLSRPIGRTIDIMDDVFDFCSERASAAIDIIENIERVMAPASLESAVGVPGEPGDPQNIEFLADAFVDIYGMLLSWAATVRGTRVPNPAKEVIWTLSKFVELPMDQMRKFVQTTAAGVRSGVARIDPEDDTAEAITLSFTLDLSIDDHLLETYRSQLKALGDYGGPVDFPSPSN